MDAKYHYAAQRDKQTLSQLAQDFALIALHYRDKYGATFKPSLNHVKNIMGELDELKGSLNNCSADRSKSLFHI